MLHLAQDFRGCWEPKMSHIGTQNGAMLGVFFEVAPQESSMCI